MLALLYIGPWIVAGALLAAFGVFDDDDDTATDTDDAADTITGTDGDDELLGTEANEEVFAKAGADEVWTLDGNDSIYGDDGNDTILGGAGDDLSRGGDGDDFIYDLEGSDTIVAGAGEDTVYSAAMVDAFADEDIAAYAEDESATFYGFLSEQFADAGTFTDDPDKDDADVIELGRGSDWVVAGAGDTVTGGTGEDFLGMFLPEGGTVTITDYNQDEDTLMIFGSSGDVTFADGGDGAAEVLVDGEVVAFLEGVDFTALSAGDVSFVTVGERP